MSLDGVLKGGGQVSDSTVQVGKGRDGQEVNNRRRELGLKGGPEIVLVDLAPIKACLTQFVGDEPNAIGHH